MKPALLLLCFLFVVSGSSFGQKDSVMTAQKDIMDVVKHILHPKTQTDSISEHANKKLLFSIVPAVGYTLQTGFAGLVSANLAFYNGEEENQKISSISTSFTYSQYRQIILPFTASIWTKGNRFHFITDTRYLNYPSDIYGLGSDIISNDSNANTGYTIDFRGIKLHQSFEYAVAKNIYAGIGFFYDHFWNIKLKDSAGSIINKQIGDQLGTKETASGLALRMVYDSRLNQINAIQGVYANVQFRPNFTFLGSDKNWSSLLADVRKYIRFPASSANTLALWGMAWMTPGHNKAPYLLKPATGWDEQYNTGRGYIQGRFRGNNLFYFENEYRFRITNNGLLGAVAFTNFQAYSGDLSSSYKSIKMGYGAGLRIKLNKNSGSNLCIDYAFGQKGSRGFFVNLGEIF